MDLRPLMMVRFVLFLVLLSNTACSQTKETEIFDEETANASFRDLVKLNFPEGNVFIGAATQFDLLSTRRGDLLKEFGYITPSNSFKLTRVHPEPGQWNWEQADDWIKLGEENKQVIRLHAPISPQCSKWVKGDERTSEELEIILEEYVTGLCQKYNDVDNVIWLDVVNETIAPDGSWFGPKKGVDLWENPWTIIGYDQSHDLKPPLYISKAFKIANEFAPDIKLIVNQHGQFEPEVWEKMKELIRYLKDMGLRVDGVGWQAHVSVGWEKINDNIERLSKWISWAHGQNLEFHVTENTVWIEGEHQWSEQAETFSAILRTLLENRDSGVVGWNVWQLVDQDTQRKMNGCIYDIDLRPKPAYFAIKDLLAHPPYPK
jgi:GH35 family endo-1,4-beta-xylanase